MLGVRLFESLYHRLANLARVIHRPKSYYVKEALKAYLDAYESELSAIAEYEDQVRKGTSKTILLEEVMHKFKLTVADLDNHDVED